MFPNLEEDEEIFEDNPEEYIRRDIEGSGTEKNFNLHQCDTLSMVCAMLYVEKDDHHHAELF